GPKRYIIGKPFGIGAFPKYGFGPGLEGPFVRSWERYGTTIVFVHGPNYLPADEDRYGDGGRQGLKPPPGTPRGGAPDTTPPTSAANPDGPPGPPVPAPVIGTG